MRKRFHQLLVPAVAEERTVLDLGQDRATWHAVVHEGVLNSLIVVAKQLMEQVWPPVLARDRAIRLIREASLQGHTLLLALRCCTASHGNGVAGNGDPYLAIRWSRN